MSGSYPINAPIDFVNTASGNPLNFNAVGTKNTIQNFVGEAPGDILVRTGVAADGFALERVAVGAAGTVLTVAGTAVAEITDITTVAQASVPASSYFLLNAPGEAYYVWYDTTGTDTDPGAGAAPADLFFNGILRTGLMVDISGDTTDIQVATSSVAVITAVADFTATNSGTAVMNIVNTVAGAVPDAVDGATGTTFTPFTVTTPGVSAGVAWTALPPASATGTFMATTTASPGTVAQSATWVTLASANVTWDDSTAPNHDTGAIFTPASGLFTVGPTGIYQLSASVSFQGNNSGTGGAGIINTRKAVRQARIRNLTTGVTMIFSEKQASANSDVPTVVPLSVAAASVTTGDTIAVQVRHDATTALNILFEEDGATSGPSTYFSASRIA